MRRFEAPTSETGDSSYYSSASDSESSSEPDSKKRRLKSPSTSSSGPSSKSEKIHAQPSGLLLSQLAIMDTSKTESDQLSVFAKSGKDPSRVKKALRETCCAANCKRGLQFRLVMNMITLFWALPKVSQDNLLWSMQQVGQNFHKHHDYESSDGGSSSSESERGPKIAWSLEGP